MRKKILLGAISAAMAVLVVGSLAFTRNAHAQDLPKPPEPAKKDGNLFELLKKELETKNSVTAPAALPQPTPTAVQPPMKEEPKSIPFPPITQVGAQTPTPLPSAPTLAPKDEANVPQIKPQEPMKPLVAPAAGVVQTQAPENVQSFPPMPKDVGVKPAFGPDTASKPLTPAPAPAAVVPPMDPSTPKFADPVQRPITNGVVPMPAKPASSPWALHVAVVEGKTIVTATVNKQHEFKIVCDSLDLQTGKGTLKASGKVRINGDALQGNCNELSIPLNEDRLVLDGKAEVRIQRVSTTVTTDTRPATFELKGESLNLRISELQSAHLIETHWRRSDETNPRDRVVPASLTNDAKQWSSWGTLRRSTEKIAGLPVWRLENSTGAVIATLVTREGGTLTQYEGRSISVFGMNEQMNGRTVLRVSHIALP